MRWSRRRVAIGVLVLALAAAAGAMYTTGTSVPADLPGPLSTSDSPTGAVEGYWADMDDGNLAAATNRTNGSLRPALPLDTDEVDLGDFLEDVNSTDDERLLAAQLDTQVNITLTTVTRRSKQGDRASVFAEVQFDIDHRETVIAGVLHDLVRRNGEWVITNFETDFL